jgi:hypothetical protein
MNTSTDHISTDVLLSTALLLFKLLKNGVLRRIFGPNGEELMDRDEFIMPTFIICTL